MPSKVALITDSSRFQVECLLSAPQHYHHIRSLVRIYFKGIYSLSLDDRYIYYASIRMAVWVYSKQAMSC